MITQNKNSLENIYTAILTKKNTKIAFYDYKNAVYFAMFLLGKNE